MTPPTIASLLATYLRLAGVTHVFGYPGESIVDFIEASRPGGPQIVSAVREASAAFMAEGAAMRTGLPGVALSTLGPGSTALLNGVASAHLDRIPLLAVSGQVDSGREQFWTHQLVDHDRLYAPVTKLTARLEPPSADVVIRKALRTATAERPGAVHVTVTHDSFGKHITGTTDGPRLPPLGPPGGRPGLAGWSGEPGGGSAATLDFCGDDPARALRAARRPVVLAGAGAVRCGAAGALADLSERIGAPVVVGAMAKGVIDERHPYFAGVLDMAGHKVVWSLLDSADLIVTAGFDSAELITPWRIGTPVLHVDTTPNTDQVYPAGIEVVGSVRTALEWLASAADGAPRWSTEEVAAHRSALRAGWEDGYEPDRLNPSDVVTTVRSAAPAGTVMTADVGSHKITAGQAWTAFAPRETLITNGLSSMGFGLPAAVGASLVSPGVPVVCLTGDGGFAMTASELSVAVRYRLPLVVVVFSDGVLNRIELHQASLGYPSTAISVDRTDVPSLAESLGCDGIRVESVSGLENALSSAFASRSRPLVIEARITTSQYSAQF
ncbi:MAG: thiamine pyrophosphate-binding protein [Nocardiopsaceae bacterium]|nr:thiamine pyrophosphate-binding protein [Nocardiopsaceae bacterium]